MAFWAGDTLPKRAGIVNIFWLCNPAILTHQPVARIADQVPSRTTIATVLAPAPACSSRRCGSTITEFLPRTGLKTFKDKHAFVHNATIGHGSGAAWSARCDARRGSQNHPFCPRILQGAASVLCVAYARVRTWCFLCHRLKSCPRLLTIPMSLDLRC